LGEKVGAVLVLGGGIAGIQASLDLADCGFKVFLVDESTSIGGTMAQLDKTFPTNDCSMCILAPKLVGAGRNPNIELITNSELKQVRGKAGNFEVEIRKHPRFVDEDKCNGCGICAQNCPVEAPNEFDVNIGIRKAIYVPFPQAVPLKYSIDYEHCIKCGLCERLCRVDAIDLDQKEELIKIQVGSIILAPGFEEFDPRLKSEYGYGRYTNVVTSIEFERILSASGPFGGKIVRPYDGKIPKKIAFVQCVGSRDAKVGNNYCSAACCMYSIKEAVIAREHNPNIQCTIFYMDIRSYGKDFELYYNRAKEEHNIEFIRSRVASLSAFPDSGEVKVKYVVNENPVEEEFDLVVLAVGMQPPKKGKELAKILRVQLNEYGFCDTSEFAPFETSKAGIFVCGAFAGPKDIPESVSQASGAAIKATKIIASEKWKLTKTKEYPPQRDVSKEEKRIGVFICHCGINIGGVVNVLEVTDYAKTLPNVVHAEHNLYTCSEAGLTALKKAIKEHDLNRVVVASCTPRTHEPLFRSACEEVGVNKYLFEMANIREQCSWVHMHEKAKATAKAKDIVRMAISKARLAISMANQGFKVYLVERDQKLGGTVRQLYKIYPTLVDSSEVLNPLIHEVRNNKNIELLTSTILKDVLGYVGNFNVTLSNHSGDREINVGTIIVACGALNYKPPKGLYQYGVYDKVITQEELDGILRKGKLEKPERIVMIQCVGARKGEIRPSSLLAFPKSNTAELLRKIFKARKEEGWPYCSRICCMNAIKNAILLKKSSPFTDVVILFGDLRVYKEYEDLYKTARDLEVRFIRHFEEIPPEITQISGDKLQVLACDSLSGLEVKFKADMVVLSTPLRPRRSEVLIAKMLKVPIGSDGFLMEAHLKLRPVDTNVDGVFIAGAVSGPKDIPESIISAEAAAARASILMGNQKVRAEAITAYASDDLCIGCGLCEEICPYGAPIIVEGKSNIREIICRGCGICAAECPMQAINMRHFENNQILSQIKSLLFLENSKGGIV